MRVTFVQKSFFYLMGIYLFATQKDKCQEKVWREQSLYKRSFNSDAGQFRL